MADKAPGNSAAEATALARQIRGAKEGSPLNFAFAMARNPADSALALGSKPGKSLEADAKKAAGTGARVFSGTVHAEGSKAIFASDDAPSNGERGIGDWVRHHKLGLGVNVTEDYANVTEDEEEAEGPKMYATEMLIRRFRMALRNPMHFGFGPGRSPEESLLALHPRREGQMLYRGIRRENHAIRGSWGMVALEGRVATFTCTEKPIPGLRKQVRAFLRGRDLRYRVKILGPEGEVLEPGDEEEDAADLAAERAAAPASGTDAPGSPSPAEAGGDAPVEADDGVDSDAKRLDSMRDQMKRMLPALQEIAQTLASRGVDIRTAHQAFRAALKDRDVKGAQDAFDALREHGRAGRADVQALATMRERLDAQVPELQRLYKARPEDAQAIRQPFQRADIALKLGDVRLARATLLELASIMKAAQASAAREAAPQGAPQRTAPADTPAFRRLVTQRIAEWREAQKQVADDLDRLANTVLARDDVLAHPRLPEIRKAMSELPGLLPDFGGKLETLLEGALNGGSVAAVLGDARGVIGDYRKSLSAASKLAAFEAFTRTNMNDNAELVGALDSNLSAFEQLLARAG